MLKLVSRWDTEVLTLSALLVLGFNFPLINCSLFANFRSETDIVNVVEQRIWHSMEEGHFENLPGKGKPLNLNSNPHADPAEDTLYRILSRNGCAPEWVELNKEIRGMIAGWRSALKKAWANQSEVDGSRRNDDCRILQEQILQINDKVLLGTSSHISFRYWNHWNGMIRRAGFM